VHCIAWTGHLRWHTYTTLATLHQSQQPRSLQTLSSISLLRHLQILAVYFLVTIIFNSYFVGNPQIVWSFEPVAAGPHMLTAPADGSGPDVHRLPCRSQTEEPETDASCFIFSSLAHGFGTTCSQKKNYGRHLLTLQGNMKGMLWTFKANAEGTHVIKNM